MNSDAFKPPPGSGQAVVRFNGAGPQLGRTAPIHAPPAPITQAPVQHNAVGGAAPAVAGAQPVRLMGKQMALGPQTQQMPLPMAPAPSAPRPSLGQAKQSDLQIHRIAVIGLGSDGQKYIARFDAAFPRGTQIQDVTEE